MTTPRDELVHRICRRMALVPEDRLDVLGRSRGSLLEALEREGDLDGPAAARVADLVRQVEARLGVRPAPPTGPVPWPTSIEIGGMAFELVPDPDPYLDDLVYSLRNQRYDRRVVFRPLPAAPALRREIEERIERVRAAAPAEATRTYRTLRIGGDLHLLTACPEGTPLPVYLVKRRPDRGRRLLLAGDLLDALSRAHEAGLVHGHLTPDRVRVSGDGRLSIDGYVEIAPRAPWAIAAGPVTRHPPGSARRDVYAAAILLHQILGLGPETEVLRQSLDDDPPPGLVGDLLAARNPELPPRLADRLVDALLATGRTSIADLRTALVARPDAAPSIEARRPAPPRRRLLPFLLALGGLSLVLVSPSILRVARALREQGAPAAIGPSTTDGAEPRPILGAAPSGAPSLTAARPDPGPEPRPPASDFLARLAGIEAIDESPRPAPGDVPPRYDDAIEAFPEEPRVWFDRGRVLFRLGRAEEALGDLDRAIEEAGRRGAPADRTVLYEALLQRSLCSVELERTETVLADLQRARQLVPERHEATFLLGRLLDRAGRHATASQLFDDALATGRPTFRGLFHRGASRYYRGDLEGSRADLMAALATGGESPGPYCYIGRIEADLGRPEAAAAAFARCLELDPEHYEGLFYSARFHHEGGRPEQAGQSFLAAARVDPRRPGAYNGLGLLAEAAGRDDEALALFERALSLDPGYLVARRNRGSLYFHRGAEGDLERAMIDFEGVLRADPDDVDVLLLLGMSLARADRPGDALGALSRAIRLDPGNARAYFNRGHLYRLHGNLERATDDFAQAVDADPDYDLPRIALGQLANAAGSLDEALDWFETACRADPDSVEAHNHLGATLALLGRLPEAVATFDRSLDLAPDDPAALGNRARCLARLGRLSEARRDFERSLDLDPEQPELRSEYAVVTAGG